MSNFELKENETKSMRDLILQGTEHEPAVRYNLQEGRFVMEGTSRPEHALEYFQPVLNWTDEFVEYCKTLKSEESFHFIFRLEYMNSISTKLIYDQLKKLEAVEGQNILIDWFYFVDDQDMQETGEEYKRLVNLSFKLHEVGA